MINYSPLEFIPAEGISISGLMMCAEAPSQIESAELVDKMIQYLGLQRSDIYITNVLKVRPEENRTPTLLELESWRPLLIQEIQEQKPRVILALGACAAQTILQSKEKISRLRGKSFSLPQSNIHVVPTWHPSYLLKQPQNKEIREQLKKDLTIVKKLLEF